MNPAAYPDLLETTVLIPRTCRWEDENHFEKGLQT